MYDVQTNLKKQRTAARLTQQQLSDLADVPQPFLSAIERGKKTPSLSTTVDLADALECSLDELIGREKALAEQ